IVLSLLDERDLLAEVRRLRGALLPGWARTDHDQVVGGAFHVPASRCWIRNSQQRFPAMAARVYQQKSARANPTFARFNGDRPGANPSPRSKLPDSQFGHLSDRRRSAQ